MKRLEKIKNSCKGPVSIEINPHKGTYQTVEDYLNINEPDENEISSKEFVEMIKRDLIFEITIYPDSPISFYILYHYDIDLLLNKTISLLKEKKLLKEETNEEKRIQESHS